MKIVIAPDSFKGSLTAKEVCATVEAVARRHFPGVEVLNAPVADGGEGTVDALVWALGGGLRRDTVTGPMGEPVEALWGFVEGERKAVLEMAQASGLPLVPADRLDPSKASSYGTGELLRLALRAGARSILLGIGGSATNDGGMGMLQALGARFFDERGESLAGCGGSLARVERADFSGLDPAILDVDLTVICDVTNPLLGPNGATRVYGPQKGARGDVLEALEAGMAHYARKVEETVGREISSMPGAGAAGGLGAALSGVLGAKLRPGIDAVLDAVGFEGMLKGADLVITGEGRIDGQSIRYGKVPAGVAARCAKQGAPVVALAGGMQDGAEGLYDIAQSSIMTTVNAIMPLEQAIRDAQPLLESAADRVFRLLKIGMRLAQPPQP